MQPVDEKTKEILQKYKKKLDTQAPGSVMDEPSTDLFTRQYDIFRKEALDYTETFYERACAFSENLIKIEPKPEQKKKLEEAIKISHLALTPTGAMSFATLAMFSLIIFGFLFAVISWLILGSPSIFISLFFILGGIIILKPLSNYSIHLAARWRLRASNQMVLCILYIVMYMRHTSNLELAVKFAGEHIGAPLSLDLRKVVWDVETGKFSNIKNSLDYYLQSWKKWNLEFVESFNLITSSLYESRENKRKELLDKSLQVILEGTYENMLHYAQDVKSPITMLHMLGVILPILGLIILPLVGSFLGVKWYHLALLYNILLPLIVYYFGYTILSKRPVGYTQSNILQESEIYKEYRMIVLGKGDKKILINPKHIAIFFAFLFLLLGFSPLLWHAVDPTFDFAITDSVWFLNYVQDPANPENFVGPLGIGASLVSLLIPLGLALSLAFYYSIRSRRIIEIRNQTKRLETEFRNALFQLGNRIGSGIPVEASFGKVSQNLKGTPTGTFFALVNTNIRKLGMSVEQAIFDAKIGAILHYPSSLIESSMKVMVETSRKGPSIVSQALLSIAEYLDRINKVTERLKDLLSEIVSSMKAQISFLTPVIAGIVVGIGTMITTIMGSLVEQVTALSSGGASGMPIDASTLLEIFPLSNVMPPFFFQMVVGIYVVEVVIVLTILANGIENGVDKLSEESSLGKNLYKSVLLYTVIAGIGIIAFNLLAQMIGGTV
ncbi:MAG: hypothetical protein ABIF40_02980 [archaeon]